jgi:hypothetical protein
MLTISYLFIYLSFFNEDKFMKSYTLLLFLKRTNLNYKIKRQIYEYGLTGILPAFIATKFKTIRFISKNKKYRPRKYL